MRKFRILAYIFLLVLVAMPFWGAQYRYISNYTSMVNDSIFPSIADSSKIIADSLVQDSLMVDSVKQKPNALDAIVDFKSNDSIVMTNNNWGYLYGDAKIDYTEIKLSGEVISMNMDSSVVEATYALDSVGKEFGYPIFTDGGTDYETKTMKYNFKTKKGYSQHLVTEQGEGFVVAGRAKKNEDNSFFMREGKYTTCDQHDHPHFYLALTKAKVNPKKNVVTGPAYLVIEGLHIPFIGLPFGFFPFTDSYSSGVIMPSYGDEMDRGFNLHDGGYYFAINDYVDLKLLGTIYTKGSWGLSGQSTYKKRYKYSGNVNIGYQVTKYGDKGLDDYVSNKDLKINWTHTQDPKANMFRTLSASVNFATSSYDRNNLNSQYGSGSTQGSTASSISFNQRFPNSPWTLSANASINQNMTNKTMNMTLPNLTASMSRIYPFKRKDAVGSEKWYEKIQFSYTGQFRNSLQTTEDDLSFGIRNWNNGANHSIPVSATFTLFDYLNITPSLQYTENWHTKMEKREMVNGVDRPTGIKENKLKRTYQFSGSLGFQTKLYGFFKPLFAKSTTIRHVFTPSITLSASPDFSDPIWGFYESIYGFDANGARQKVRYSPYAYSGSVFSPPGAGASGTITFDFQNNIEMKTPWASDSTGYKKLSLIDNLGINFSYNTQADSLKWSDIRTNLRLKLSKSLTVNLSASFDPYLYDYVDPNAPDEQKKLKKVDRLRISNGKGFGTLKSTSYSISPSINQDTFNKWFGKDEKKKETESSSSDDGDDKVTQETRRLLGSSNESQGEYDSDGYLKTDIKWNLGISYSMTYAQDFTRINLEKKEPKMKLTHSLSFNGSIQPTKNWNLTFNGSYDFEMKKIPHMSLSLTRDLHCWSISGSVTPVGLYKSYYVTIRANSSLLQDLKHEFKGRSSTYDPNWD